MINYGKTITALRKKSGMTQAELGNALNVTYQAVSKWENDLSQPSIDVLADICKIFNVTMDEFVKMARNEEVNTTETAPTSTESLTREETAEVIREELARAEAEKQRVIKAEQLKKERYAQAAAAAERRTEANWFRAGFIISCVVALIARVANIIGGEIFGGIILAYAIIAFGSQLGHDGIVTEFFCGSWEKSIGMPGIIFSFDLGGILFFLAYKLIIAPIISFLLGLIIGIGGTIIAILISMVTFPFKVVSIFRDMSY